MFCSTTQSRIYSFLYFLYKKYFFSLKLDCLENREHFSYYLNFRIGVDYTLGLYSVTSTIDR